MFNNFTRGGHNELSEEVLVELEALGLKHGLRFSVTGGSIGMTDLTIKIKASTDDPHAAIDQAKRELSLMGRQWGLDESHYGKKFKHGSKMFQLTGVKPSRPKYPVSATCLATGKQYKFPAYVLNEIRG